MIKRHLIDYIYMLKNKLWIIVLTTVLLLLIGGILSFYIIKPEYQAFSTLMIGKPQGYVEAIEYNDILLSQKLVSTYSEIAKSRTVSNEVIKNLGLNITYETIRKKVSITQVGDTGIIKIESRYDKPEVAAKLADAIAEAFMKKVVKIMNVENVQIIDSAEIPSKPKKPIPALIMAATGMLGIILGVLVALLVEYLDNTVKTSEDIANYIELPVIGMIP